MADELLLIKIVGKDETAQAFATYAENAAEAYRKASGGSDDYEKRTKRLQNSLNELYKRIENGGAVSVGAVAKIATQHELLRREIERTWGSIDKAAPEVVQHYKAIGVVLERTKGMVREVNDAVNDSRDELGKYGAQWNGLGDGIEKLAGKHGVLVGQIGLVVTAWREGWAAGKQFGEVIGVNYDAWNGFVGNVKKTTTPTVNAIGDIVLVVNSLVGSLITLDEEYSKNALFNLLTSGGSLMAPLPTVNPVRPGAGLSQDDRDALQRQIDLIQKEAPKLQLQLSIATQQNDERLSRELTTIIAARQRDLARLQAEMQFSGRDPNSVAAVTREAEEIEELTLRLYDLARADRDTAKARRESAEAMQREKALAAMQQQIDLLNALTPLQTIEIEYEYDIATARRSHTGALRDQAIQLAELTRLKKLDAALGYPLAMVDPAITEFTVELARRNYQARRENEQFAEDFMARGRAWGRQWIEDSGKADAAKAESERKLIAEWQSAHESFLTRATDVFADLALTGGENFGSIAGRRFSELVGKGFSSLFSELFQAPTQDQYGRWHVGDKVFENEADAWKAAGPKAAKASAALDFAMIGAGAYSGSYAADGARTAGTISGGVAGASAGLSLFGAGLGASALAMTGWGAVIGIIVAGIAGALGEAARQEEYKYFVPTIDENGVARLEQTKNIERLEQEQLTSQLQAEYEASRNAYAKILLKAGVDIPDFQAIYGQFQPEGSQHTLKHFGQWMANELDEIVYNQVRPAVVNAFKGVGLSEMQFRGFETEFERLDPKKARSLWTELFGAMSSITDANVVFGRSYGDAMGAERTYMGRSADQVLKDDYFSKIMELSRGLDVLVGEDRVHLLNEIAQLQTAGAEAYKQALREIIAAAEQARERSAALRSNIELMMMRKPDGSVDYEAQANYLKQKLEQEFAEVNMSTNAADLARNQQEALELINQIVNLGYSQDWKTGQAYGTWALDVIRQLEAMTGAKFTEIGNDVTEAGNTFAEDWKAIQATIQAAGTDVGESVNDLDDEVKEVIGIIDRFGNAIANNTPGVATGHTRDGHSSVPVVDVAAVGNSGVDSATRVLPFRGSDRYDAIEPTTAATSATDDAVLIPFPRFSYTSGEAAPASESDLLGAQLIVGAVNRGNASIVAALRRHEQILMHIAGSSAATAENTDAIGNGGGSSGFEADTRRRRASA